MWGLGEGVAHIQHVGVLGFGVGGGGWVERVVAHRHIIVCVLCVCVGWGSGS